MEIALGAMVVPGYEEGAPAAMAGGAFQQGQQGGGDAMTEGCGP